MCLEFMKLIYTSRIISRKQIRLLRKMPCKNTFLIHGNKQMLIKGKGLITVSITRTGLLSCRGTLVLIPHIARRLRWCIRGFAAPAIILRPRLCSRRRSSLGAPLGDSLHQNLHLPVLLSHRPLVVRQCLRHPLVQILQHWRGEHSVAG